MAAAKKKDDKHEHHHKKRSHVEQIEERIAVCREYAAHWEEYFKCFGTNDIRDRKVTDQEENQFGKLSNLLARKLFRFTRYVGDKFSDSDDILELLQANESLRGMQDFSDANFSKTEVTWHQIFINMHRAVGRLTRELPAEEHIEGTDTPPASGGSAPPPRGGPPGPPRPGGALSPPKLGGPTPPRPGTAPGAPKPPRPGAPKPPTSKFKP